MLKFFRNKINKNKEGSAEFRLAFAMRIKNKRIRYVSERTADGETGEMTDTILGKEGYFNINRNNELEIHLAGQGEALFRAYIPELAGSELLSLEGAVLEGVDLISGRHRKIIAYYKYYR